MHAVYVTQKHDVSGWGSTDSHWSPLFLLRVWALCSASWDVLSRICSRSNSPPPSPSLKLRETEGDNKYSAERIDFIAAVLWKRQLGA